ncbi:hypothetical protein [Acetobacter pasteurianus]|nr:hypothetical protein [Acetobacter pasteurianus]
MTRYLLIITLVLAPAMALAKTRPNHDLPQFKKLGQPATTQPTAQPKK